MKEKYNEKTIVTILKQRIPWLAFFLGGLLVCASVMHKYESLLQSNLQLAFFVPLIIGHGGNSGGQTVSTIIREMSYSELNSEDIIKVSFKEGLVGALQSILLVIFMLPYMFLMNITTRVIFIVFITMIFLGIFANTFSSLLIFWVINCGLDPAIIVAPCMTTLIDSVGIFSYLLFASIFLNNLSL